MKDETKRKNRLSWMSRNGLLPFDLDFLREIGFEFGLDWDNQLIIEYPKAVSIDILLKLITKYEGAIKKRLYFEGQKAKRIFVGGPLNGQPYFHSPMPNEPICHHVKHGEWLVYMTTSFDDPRAWYAGKASSKKKAKSLIFE